VSNEHPEHGAELERGSDRGEARQDPTPLAACERSLARPIAIINHLHHCRHNQDGRLNSNPNRVTLACSANREALSCAAPSGPTSKLPRASISPWVGLQERGLAAGERARANSLLRRSVTRTPPKCRRRELFMTLLARRPASGVLVDEQQVGTSRLDAIIADHECRRMGIAQLAS
jgi:hypothetical protein